MFHNWRKQNCRPQVQVKSTIIHTSTLSFSLTDRKTSLYFCWDKTGEWGGREDEGGKKDQKQNLTGRDCHHHQKLIRSREIGETSFTFITRKVKRLNRESGNKLSHLIVKEGDCWCKSCLSRSLSSVWSFNVPNLVTIASWICLKPRSGARCGCKTGKISKLSPSAKQWSSRGRSAVGS